MYDIVIEVIIIGEILMPVLYYFPSDVIFKLKDFLLFCIQILMMLSGISGIYDHRRKRKNIYYFFFSEENKIFLLCE